MKSRTLYYLNSAASFNISILISGDVHPHPGPDFSTSQLNDINSHSPVLRCFYKNVRSVQSGNKLREFQDMVYASQFNIVAISET